MKRVRSQELLPDFCFKQVGEWWGYSLRRGYRQRWGWGEINAISLFRDASLKSLLEMQIENQVGYTVWELRERSVL